MYFAESKEESCALITTSAFFRHKESKSVLTKPIIFNPTFSSLLISNLLLF